jgi:hypothetical protein
MLRLNISQSSELLKMETVQGQKQDQDLALIKEKLERDMRELKEKLQSEQDITKRQLVTHSLRPHGLRCCRRKIEG